MIADEIVKLTRDGITKLLSGRAAADEEYEGKERRRVTRWPFPGAVELRPVDETSTQQWFGTCRDVSESGLGMAGEQYFEPGTKLQVAFHLPEASFYGHGIVRYCQEIRGRYMTGLAFVFDE